MGKYKELKVWQKAMDLAVKVYKKTENGPISKDFGLRDQIRRSSVSIVSNIAEGDELDTVKQGIKHFYYSRGSLAELETQLMLCQRIGYDQLNSIVDLLKDCKEIGAMLNGLINYRSKTN